jgi:hypothetical protein
MDTESETELTFETDLESTHEEDTEMELTTTINDHDWTSDNDEEQDADFEPDPNADEQEAEIDRAEMDARDSMERFSEMYLAWDVKWLLADGDFSEAYLLPTEKLPDIVWAPTEHELDMLEYEGWACGWSYRVENGASCHAGKYAHWHHRWH